MEVTIAFNELTHVGDPGQLASLYIGFLPVLERLSTVYAIRRIDYDRRGAVADFRNYVIANPEALGRQIGRRDCRRIQDLFVHFMRPLENPIKGVVQAGLHSAECWSRPEHSADDGEYLCITLPSHMDEQPFLRWAFSHAMLPFDVIRPKMLSHGYKHYKLQGEPESNTHPTRRTAWVRRTGNGEPAQFRPGLKFFGKETECMVRQILIQAFSRGFVTYSRLHGFVGAMTEIVGASDGEPTARVKIDINHQDEFHLIPVA